MGAAFTTLIDCPLSLTPLRRRTPRLLLRIWTSAATDQLPYASKCAVVHAHSLSGPHIRVDLDTQRATDVDPLPEWPTVTQPPVQPRSPHPLLTRVVALPCKLPWAIHCSLGSYRTPARSSIRSVESSSRRTSCFRVNPAYNCYASKGLTGQSIFAIAFISQQLATCVLSLRLNGARVAIMMS